MTLTTTAPRTSHRTAGAGGLTLLATLVCAAMVAVGGTAQAAATAVPLATAGTFSVLAGAGVTNTGPTTLAGDLGTFPTLTITGEADITVNGTNHGGDGVTQGAKDDLITAYENAAAQGPTSPIVADLGGQTLLPGVYNSGSSIGLTGALTLDAQDDPDAVFVFQAGSALTTASASSVVLLNGAQPCNVFWQVTSSATLGTGTSFVGTIIALQDITLTTAATVEGRVLARNGAVTLDTNTIRAPDCASTSIPTPTETSIPTSSVTASDTPSAEDNPDTTTPTGSSSGIGTPEATTPAADTPTRQVPRVPSGSVGTGDGSTDAGPGPGLAVVIGALAIGGTALATSRRRHG